MRVEMVTGPIFSSPNQPDQERTTAYRDRSGPNSRSRVHCATLVDDWEKPPGESRLNRAAKLTDDVGPPQIEAENLSNDGANMSNITIENELLGI